MQWKVCLTDTTLGEEEALAAAAVVRSGWLTQGEGVAAFERAFAEKVGVPHAVAVSNCTVGLEIAYCAVGVSAGDEVVMPALTFVATANAARRLGATPVFADIASTDDLTVDPNDVLAKVSARTRAVVVVHYGGFVAEVDAIRNALNSRGLQHVAIVEDCAHAPGASIDQRACGALGDVGAFSFFSNKNMTTGEGGMLTTRDAAIAQKLRAQRSHGMTSTTWDRHRGHAFSYDVTEVGTNARMDEIRAAIGRVQLSKLADANRRRREVVNCYREEMALRAGVLRGVTAPFARHRGESAHHLFVVLLPPDIDRFGVMASMREEGVQTSVHYPPTHLFSAYRAYTQPLPKTEEVASRLVTLPLSASMTRAEVTLVLDALGRAIATTPKEID